MFSLHEVPREDGVPVRMKMFCRMMLHHYAVGNQHNDFNTFLYVSDTELYVCTRNRLGWIRVIYPDANDVNFWLDSHFEERYPTLDRHSLPTPRIIKGDRFAVVPHND